MAVRVWQCRPYRKEVCQLAQFGLQEVPVPKGAGGCTYGGGFLRSVLQNITQNHQNENCLPRRWNSKLERAATRQPSTCSWQLHRVAMLSTVRAGVRSGMQHDFFDGHRASGSKRSLRLELHPSSQTTVSAEACVARLLQRKLRPWLHLLFVP